MEAEDKVLTAEQIEKELQSEEAALKFASQRIPAGVVNATRTTDETEKLLKSTYDEDAKLAMFNIGALKVLAEVAASQQALSVSDQLEVQLNKFLNIIDPPKDLKIPTTDGNTLSSLTKTQKTILKNILIETFFDSIANEEQFKKFLAEQDVTSFSPVGDAKDKLVSKIKSVFKNYFDDRTNKYTINRISKGYSGGINPLEYHFIVQDNGPLEIFANNCIFVNTPGSVMDPAFRKTSGTDVLNILPGEYISAGRQATEITLPTSNIDELSLETVITGPITMTRETEGRTDFFKVKMDIQYYKANNQLGQSTLEGKFLTNKAFESQPLSSSDSDYFAGNAEKNKEIYDILHNISAGQTISDNNKVKIIRFILAKEIGDTILVKWIDHALSAGMVSAIIDRVRLVGDKNNTLINTSDTVVWLRCIVNGMGCIFTERDIVTKRNGSTIYPTYTMDETQKALLVTTHIQALERQTIRNNESVIAVVKEIQQTIQAHITAGLQPTSSGRVPPMPALRIFEKDIPGKDLPFLNFLFKYIIYRLEKYNTDLHKTLNITTNLETAKQAAKDGEFNLPFVKKGNEYVIKVAKNNGFLPNDKIRFNLRMLTGALLTRTKETAMKTYGVNDALITSPTVTAFERLTPFFSSQGGDPLATKMQSTNVDSLRLAYNKLYNDVENATNHIATRSEKASAKRKLFFLRQLRPYLLKQSLYKTLLLESENPSTENKGEKLIDAAIVYSRNKRVDDLKLPTPPITADPTVPNSISYASDLVVEIFKANYESANTTEFLYWFVLTYMPSIFQAGICLKLAIRSYLMTVEGNTASNIEYPITNNYAIANSSVDYFKNIFTVNYEEPILEGKAKKFVFSQEFTRPKMDILNSTNELIAYAKFFYENIRPEALSPQISAFFNEIDEGENSADYSNYCDFITMYSDLEEAVEGSADFLLDVLPSEYEIYGPVVQLGGDRTSQIDMRDFVSVMANEFYDFYYDLEHLRCIDNLADYTTYTKRYEEALTNADEFSKYFTSPMDVARSRAFKDVIQTQYNAITGRKNNTNSTRKNKVMNTKNYVMETNTNLLLSKVPLQKTDLLNEIQAEENPILIGGSYRTKQTRRYKKRV